MSHNYQSKKELKNKEEKFVIDKVDEEIIEILSTDGRKSNTEMAAMLHLAEATVRRRVNRLLESDLIKIVAIPNPKQFSKFTSAVMGVSCTGAYIDEIANFLVGLSETSYVGYSTGKWDLVVEGFFMSHDHLLDFLLDLSKREGVNDIESSLILRVSKLSYECDVINYRQTVNQL